MDSLKTTDMLGQLNREQFRIAALGWPVLLAYVAANSGIYIYLDLSREYDNGLYALANLVMWAVGYALQVGLMQRAGYFGDGKRSGVGTYFVLGILVVLAVLFGLLLLVLPGLYLMLRLLPVYADALVNGGGATAAIRRSWKSTADAMLPLALAAIAPVTFSLMGLGVIVIAEFDPTLYNPVTIVIGDIAFAVGFAWFTTLGIASFGILAERPQQTDLQTSPA